ncbi:hypothetical protein APR12_006837 [Nocardia amikacinitolerans]|uniref:hypothetical protein n=1 Tax=Nocardia amikacinitolerans TaxID=756689 RepID=UPI00083116C6|nr:hypothetical protein [Nocardia amikacinitolerans]MCP2321445.1 hypothetical protein [Nocardia amikacinitolerans]
MYFSLLLVVAVQPDPTMPWWVLALPVIVIVVLVAVAALVAALAGAERSVRARLVLGDLLVMLQRGGRR